jgi:hypothetical protein
MPGAACAYKMALTLPVWLKSSSARLIDSEENMISGRLSLTIEQMLTLISLHLNEVNQNENLHNLLQDSNKIVYIQMQNHAIITE